MAPATVPVADAAPAPSRRDARPAVGVDWHPVVCEPTGTGDGSVMKVSTRLLLLIGGCHLAGWPSPRAAEVPAVAEAPREVAADGTVSVVVEPATAQVARPDRSAPAPAGSEATVLLGRLLEPFAADPGRAVHDRPLPLLEALERSGDRSRRLWITQAYWRVGAAFAALRQATTAVERLELVAPGAATQDRAVLDALVAEARSERASAQAALVAAQQELIDLVRLPPGDPLPRPVDRPLVAPYQTHFESIFANRVATGRVRGINRSLPARHEALETRAAAVKAAAEAFATVEAEHAQGRLPIEAVAAAAERLEAQERKFIDDVRAYNNEIAEYVMAVVDLSVPDDRFAAMLIGTPIPWRHQPAVIAAGATAAVPPAAAQPPRQPAIAAPPPVLIPPAGLQAAPPSLQATPGLAPVVP